MTTASDFNPEMLALARRSRELTQTELAELSAVTRTSISRYEMGTLPVPNDSLCRLAVALDYPVKFFCRKATTVGMMGGAVFHRKQQSLPVKKLYRAHALADTRRLEITTMLDSLDIQTPFLPQYLVDLFDDDPEKIARSVRAALNIPPGPIFNLTDTLERSGCVVVPHDFNSRQIDGFSQQTRYPPCFFHLNTHLPPDRWRWTLAHELGHSVMHFDPMASPKLVEQQANLFAAEFLTPAHEIGHFLDGLTFQKLGGLKIEWGVSMQALITRAYHLGNISESQRRSMYSRLSSAGYRTREPETLDPPVEKPSKMAQLAQRHLDELSYSRTELCDLLAIGEAEFKRHYIGSDDILETLGIDEILQS